MIEKAKLKILTPLEKSVYLYIEQSHSFPLSIRDLRLSLGVSRQSMSKIINRLLELDLIDVLEYKTHKEIFKKDYLFGDEI